MNDTRLLCKTYLS